MVGKKRQYQQAELSELGNMRTEDPNSYWKFWKSLNPRNVTTGPTLADFVNYFEQQIYPPHVDYFDYEHMNNVIKQVTSFQHNVEHDKSNMTLFLNSLITAEEIKKAIQKLKCKKAAGVTTYQEGCCSRILLFGFLGPVRDVSVAFVIRRGRALWWISELLSQLIFSMRSGMFFFDCNSEYVVLTRS